MSVEFRSLILTILCILFESAFICENLWFQSSFFVFFVSLW